MASSQARKLYAVDEATGEFRPTEDACPSCQTKQFQLDELTLKYHGALAQIGRLKADLAPAEGHHLFPLAKSLHDHYKVLCRHPHHKRTKSLRCAACERIKFTVDRFNEVKPRLQEHGDEAEELCRRAIEGAAYDPFITQRKNGTPKYHNDWHQIFAADKFMEFCNKAPYHLPDPKKVLTLANALMFLHKWEPDRAVPEAQRRLKHG